MSRWKNPIGDTDFATMVLGRADENNCMKIEFGFDAQHLYRTNAIKNNFFFSQQQNNENYTDFGDYWWGGASTFYFAGGLNDNLDSTNLQRKEDWPFQPDDFISNWGGLIELGCQNSDYNL